MNARPKGQRGTVVPPEFGRVHYWVPRPHAGVLAGRAADRGLLMARSGLLDPNA